MGINSYYWVDDHPLLYGNNGSLDPGTSWFYKGNPENTLPKFNSSPLKSYRAPIGKDRLPTIVFQGRTVKLREGNGTFLKKGDRYQGTGTP